MSPFDFVKDVSHNKVGIFNSENEEDYVPFIVNRAFSYYLDAIMHSNEMNMNPHLDKQLQYDFYFHGLRKRKRYSPWHKRIDSEKLQEIMDQYNCGVAKAKEILSVLQNTSR